MQCGSDQARRIERSILKARAAFVRDIRRTKRRVLRAVRRRGVFGFTTSTA